MENIMTEEQIKNDLGLKDWRNLDKDKVIKIFNYITKASPETAKELLTQLPEIKEASKEFLSVYKGCFESIVQSNEKTTGSIIESVNNSIKSINELIDDDKELTIEQKNMLIDKQIELIKILDSLDTKNKIFLKHNIDDLRITFFYL